MQISHFMSFVRTAHYYESGKNVYQIGIPTTKNMKKFSVIGIFLIGTPFHISEASSLRAKFDEINSELEKKRQPHLGQNNTLTISEESDFLCIRFQMCTMHLGPLSASGTKVFQMAKKKATTARKNKKN